VNKYIIRLHWWRQCWNYSMSKKLTFLASFNTHSTTQVVPKIENLGAEQFSNFFNRGFYGERNIQGCSKFCAKINGTSESRFCYNLYVHFECERRPLILTEVRLHYFLLKKVFTQMEKTHLESDHKWPFDWPTRALAAKGAEK
jgi:hypothetical protein